MKHSNPRQALRDNVDPEDQIKVEIETNGGRQTVNAVNESGLYALIFGSKLDTAKRFKRWVTSEVLPTIRRTGRYEAPKPEYITVEHRWAIQKAVGRKARGQSVNYQTVYRALKDHFKVEKYTHILEADFDAAIAFIESLPPMQLPPLNAPHRDSCLPHLRRNQESSSSMRSTWSVSVRSSTTGGISTKIALSSY